MESVNSRKFIREFRIKGDKILKLVGTGEVKEYINNKSNLTKIINDCKNQIEEYTREEKFTRINNIFFMLLIPFLLLSAVASFCLGIFSATRSDIFSIFLSGLICILATTLFLVSREYNAINKIHRKYIDDATEPIKNLKLKLAEFEEKGEN